MTLDRSIAPAIAALDTILIPQIDEYRLSNGIRVIELNSGSQDIVKLEYVHAGGRYQESQKLAAKLYSSTLRDGTSSRSSAQIAEKIDYYGATLSSRSGMDSCSLILYSLHKHLDQLLPIFLDVCTDPVFPEEEIRKTCVRSSEKLKIQLAKNEVLAYREITSLIFGDDHPYGYNTYPEQYLKLDRNLAQEHFDHCIHTEGSFIIISGKITDAIRLVITSRLEQIPIKENKRLEKVFDSYEMQAQRLNIEGPNSYQKAIRVGKKLCSREHDDYAKLYVTNTVLGGYFGSRLMSSIREEKGYAYGVFSMLDTMAKEGSFYISTEVAIKNAEATLLLMQKEIQELQDKLISKEEHRMVTNYIMGSFINMLDGPFKTSELIRTLYISGLDFHYLDSLIHTIRDTSRQEIQDIAKKYLQWEDMSIVMV